MARNNTYFGETKEARLKRFRDNSPKEIIEDLLTSIQNYFNNEIKATLKDPDNRQTLLMLLGIHSVALTISHGFFNKEGVKGYRKFLLTYMDGDSSDLKYSTIAKELHAWRNVIAHRWLNILGHEIGYDYEMSEGWKKVENVIYINPKIYLQQYLRSFNSKEGGILYKYSNILNTEAKLSAAKERFLSKYKEQL
ncbi:MAG: hypothetical protein IPO62_17815 [Saprospiraceae bacterium]|nr:hypothetical protein [Saprospiraceae bacterium]